MLNSLSTTTMLVTWWHQNSNKSSVGGELCAVFINGQLGWLWPCPGQLIQPSQFTHLQGQGGNWCRSSHQRWGSTCCRPTTGTHGLSETNKGTDVVTMYVVTPDSTLDQMSHTDRWQAPPYPTWCYTGATHTYCPVYKSGTKSDTE